MKASIITLVILSIIAIGITGFWDTVNSTVLPNTFWGLYDRDFFENLLVEIHGAILDLLVIGIILYWFNKRKSERDNIKESKKILEHLKYYCGSDASFRFYGAIKHLASLGIHEVSIPEAKLNNLKIDELKLSSSNLVATDFTGSILTKVELQDCNLEASRFIDATLKAVSFKSVKLNRSKFINAKLKSMDFRNCEIKGAIFKNASLQSANFRGVDCTRVSFKGANLRSANFIDATNLTSDMVLEADNYDHIKLPDGININRGGIEHPSET